MPGTFRTHLSLLAFAASALLGNGNADAETYVWTGSDGVVHFSDTIPLYRGDGQTATINIRDDITLGNPDVRKEVAEGKRRADKIRREQAALSAEYGRREQEETDRLRAREILRKEEEKPRELPPPPRKKRKVG